MHKFFEDIATDLNYKYQKDRGYDIFSIRQDIPIIIRHLEEMVNYFGISYSKLLDEISLLGDSTNINRIWCEGNIGTIAALIVWYYATNPGAWVDGRNEISVGRCQHLYTIPAFKDFYADIAQNNLLPTNLDDLKYAPDYAVSPVWIQFIKSYDQIMHRTNVQTSIGFMLYVIAHTYPDNIINTINKEMSDIFGEDYWRLPLI